MGANDIQILPAKQSDGLLTCLIGEGCKRPVGAEDVLQDDIMGGMKFSVAKVILARHSDNTAQKLEPPISGAGSA